MSRMETETVRVPFRRWLQQSAASGGTSNLLALNANQFGDVITAMRTSFEHWKLNRLKASVWLSQTVVSVVSSGTLESADETHAVGYTCVCSNQFASVPSMNSATQLPVFAMNSNAHAVINVPKSELAKRTVKWLLTTNTGTQPEELQQHGTLYYASLSTTSCSGLLLNLLIEGEIEFRDRIDSSVALYRPPNSGNPNESSPACSDACRSDEKSTVDPNAGEALQPKLPRVSTGIPPELLVLITKLVSDLAKGRSKRMVSSPTEDDFHLCSKEETS